MPKYCSLNRNILLQNRNEYAIHAAHIYIHTHTPNWQRAFFSEIFTCNPKQMHTILGLIVFYVSLKGKICNRRFQLPPSLLPLFCLFIQIANGQNNFYHFISSQIKIEIFNFLNVNEADWQLCAIRPKKKMVLSRYTIKMNFNIAWQKLIAKDCKQKETNTTTMLPHNLSCS